MCVIRSMILIRTIVVTTVLVFTLPTVSAQSAVTPPTPGSIITSTDAPVIQSDVPAPASVKHKEKDKLVPPTSSKKILVKQFELVGNSLFEEDVLLGEIAELSGTEISIEGIYQAADKLQRFYRERGYLLASVYVPAQKISSGKVRLEIIEGRLESVVVEDVLESYSPRFLINYFDATKLGEVISQSELEQKISKLNDLPGLTTRAVILPGSKYGTSNIALQAVEDRSSITLRVNNYGRMSLGETRLEAGWLFVNPFSQGDQFNLSAIFSEDSRMTFVRGDYGALVNKYGTRIGGSISTFDYEVDTDEINLTGVLEGDGNNFRVFTSHPLIRSRNNRLDLGAAFRVSETGESGSLALTTDTKSIDILDLFLNWRPTHDGGAVSSVAVTYSSNFKDNADGTENDALKSRLTFDYNLVKPFAQTWFVQFAVNLVTSDDPLPDVERYRIGGPANVRAYPSAELAGDEGNTIRFDVGKRFNFGGGTNMVVKLFADKGTVERTIPAAGEDSKESLSGYGVGVLFDFGSGHSLELDVVEPDSDLESSDDRGTRTWLNYSIRI